MIVSQWFGVACIVSLVICCFVHSIGGEILLFRPLFKHRGNRVLDSELARMVLRYAWHLTSIMWLVLAIIVYAALFDADALKTYVLVPVGAAFIFVGVVDLIASKGKHIGWLLLMMVGVFSTLAFVS